MKIYKHLLEEEKLKNAEIEKSSEKIKSNFHSLAFNTLNNFNEHNTLREKGEESSCKSFKKDIELLKTELNKKNETIRGLKGKVN